VRDLPVGGVDFDLDSVERDAQDVYPLFHSNIGGKRIPFINPDEVDWQDLAFLDSPVELLQFLVTPEDLRHIREQKIPGWKLGKLMEAVTTHYGWDKKFEQAQREARQRSRGL
jgi:hypothetical protein